MSYQDLITEAELFELKANELRRQAEKEHLESVKKGGIENWYNYVFQGSCTATPEFNSFCQQMKKELIKIMRGYKLVNWIKGHFEFSAFFERSGKYVYISCSDVRFFPNQWYDELLIRSAKNEKDYTGGMNYHISIEKLKETADKILGLGR